MLTIDVTSDIGQLSQQLRSARREIKTGSKPAMERVKFRQNKNWQENFNTEGGRYGKWAPLKPMTIQWREDEGYPPIPILRRSGTLLAWVQTNNAKGKAAAQSILWTFHTDGAKDGSYALYHDSGYYNKLTHTRVPARKVWDINGDDVNDAEEELTRWVDDVLAAHF